MKHKSPQDFYEYYALPYVNHIPWCKLPSGSRGFWEKHYNFYRKTDEEKVEDAPDN